MPCWVSSSSRQEDRNVVARARRLERFLTQPFFTTEQFTGLKGKLVGLKESLDGCERILRDEFKDFPESALYMIGAIEEAKGKAQPGQATAPTEPPSIAEDKAKPKPAAPPLAKGILGPPPESGAELPTKGDHATVPHDP